AARQADRERLLDVLAGLVKRWPDDAGRAVLEAVARALEASTATRLVERGHALADRAVRFAADMDFSLLNTRERNRFAVGGNVHLGRGDAAHYDLLGSEWAPASFLAVARGDAPRRHWFKLGRPLPATAGGLALLSWGGTMFEYLMPRLLLRLLPGTLME